jgi:uncharacterized protein (TIGR03437 family)
VFRSWFVLAVLCAAAARGAAPSYSAASIVNTPDYALGPFAPGSIVTIFGTGLARSAQAGELSAGGGQLPTEINFVRVYVSDSPAAMFYVSATQINFLMPSNRVAGPATVRVVVEGSSGPEIPVALVDAVPALFPMPSGYAIATHVDGTLLTADSPAHSGEFVVIYLTGLGRTVPNPGPGEVPAYAAWVVRPGDLKVSLGGVVMDSLLVKYAGVTPGFAGLYQINLAVPAGLGTDPELLVSLAGQPTPAGLKLALR